MLTQVIGYFCYLKGDKKLGPLFVSGPSGHVHYLDIEKGEMFDFDKQIHTIGI